MNQRIKKYVRSLDTQGLDERIAKRERGEAQEPARKADIAERMQSDELYRFWKISNRFWWTA